MASGGGTARQEKVYAHYNHTDPCRHLRWTARESYEFMRRRPWQKIADFYADVVLGHASLLDLFPASENLCSEETCHIKEDRRDPEPLEPCAGKSGRWERATFKIVVSYHGGSFDGWQKQPGLNTVQGMVERSLGGFVDEKKAKQLSDKCLPVEPCAVVAGRTDKGVTALRQVCSFYSWRQDIYIKDIEEAVNNAAPGKLKALNVCKVSRSFHPNFSAKWRRYFYIFPLNDDEENTSFSSSDSSVVDEVDGEYMKENYELDEKNINLSHASTDNEPAILEGLKPKSFCIEKVNELLQQLEGKSLSYKMFARDTKASRNIGPATECFMFHARVVEARLPSPNKAFSDSQRVMCVELVANRFLRKMVRVLVATAVREAAAGSKNETLLRLMDATCRRATAPPAPPDGLCLVEVGYEEFRKESCLIS